jgi:hypothetical protein
MPGGQKFPEQTTIFLGKSRHPTEARWMAQLIAYPTAVKRRPEKLVEFHLTGRPDLPHDAGRCKVPSLTFF